MNEKKRLNRFENTFQSAELPTQIALQNEGKIILSENVGDVIQEKFEALLNLYKKTSFENGYNPAFSYRILMLYLLSEVKNRAYNYFEEVNRFIKFALDQKDFENIQKSLDLLILKPLVYKVPDRQIKLWKIMVLKGVRKHYKRNKLNKQKRKVSRTIKNLCVQTLKKQDIKKDNQIYCQILNYYLEEQQHTIQSLMKKKKYIPAIECSNSIIRIIEKIESQILPKYQKQLMKAYWNNAMLHNKLHYITYAKKYAQIALNIAQRIEEQQQIEQMKRLIEQLTI